ncbi:MAG: hypothetical protein OHK0015_05450 [Chloroflexi bacterium OHK40]
MREKWLAGGFSLAMLGAVIWPVIENWRPHPRDTFPLSYYPMFSARRGEREKVTYVLGIDRNGQRRTIPYDLIGVGGFNQVRRQVRQIVARGQAETLCSAVAARVAPLYPDIVRVIVVTGTYNLDRYFAGDRSPLKEVVHAEVCCASPGAPDGWAHAREA